MRRSIIAIYCFPDDLLKAINHREDKGQLINDAQMLATALIAMLDYDGSYQKALDELEQPRLFSHTLSCSPFSRKDLCEAESMDLS